MRTLRGRQRKTHALEVPSLSEMDMDNYMTINDIVPIGAKIALFDSASTHTIFQNQDFFMFP